MSHFNSLSLHESLISLLKENGISKTTSIQSKAIPLILNNQNLLAQAPTGSGKTLAFVLPILHFFHQKKLKRKGAKALILSPTRELVLQTENVIKQYTQGSHLRVVSLYSGQRLKEQEEKLRTNPDIINCAPGRLIDYVNTGVLDLNEIAFSVIDEGDRLLEMGFSDDVEFLLSKIPLISQRLMFSATYSKDLLKVARKHMLQAKECFVYDQGEEGGLISYFYIRSTEEKRFQSLVHFLEDQKNERTLIFVKGRNEVENVARKLKKRNLPVEEFHADLDVVERDSSLRRLKKGIVNILVCSDLAARGLDIEDIKNVIHLHLPDSVELYVHRSGRTGRAFSKGKCYTIITSDAEYDKLFSYHKKRVKTQLKEFSKSKKMLNKELELKKEVFHKIVLFNKGSSSKLSPGNFVGMLINELGIERNDIGNINIYTSYTEIGLPAKYANMAISKIDSIKGKTLKCKIKVEKSEKRYKNRDIETRNQSKTNKKFSR